MNGKFRDIAYLIVAILFTLMVSGGLIVLKNNSISGRRTVVPVREETHASYGGAPVPTHVAGDVAAHGSTGAINDGKNPPPVSQLSSASLTTVSGQCAAATAVQVCSHRGAGKSVGLAAAMNAYAQEVGLSLGSHVLSFSSSVQPYKYISLTTGL